MLKFSRSSCLTSALGFGSREAHSEGHLGILVTSVPLKFSGPVVDLEAIQASLQRSAFIFILSNESEAGMLKPQGPEQQFAFKDLMIHLILQFTLHIAFRGVLHRCGNQEIHR